MSSARISIDGLSQAFHALPQSLRPAEEPEASESPAIHSGEVKAVQRQTAKHHQRLAHLEKAFAKLEKRLDGLHEYVGESNFRTNFLNSLRKSATNSDSLTPHQDRTPTSTPDALSSAEAFPTLTTAIDSNVDAFAPHSARLDAMEATCGDLRHSVQDAMSMAESTERLLRAALDREAGQLRNELGNHRVQVAADQRQLEAISEEATRRVQDIERRVEEARHDHLANTSSLNARMERALRSIDEHSTEAGHLHAMLKGELMQDLGALRESMGLEFTKLKRNAQGLGQTEQVASQTCRVVEESNLRIKELELKHTKQAEDIASVQLHLQELERIQVQQRQVSIGSEASVASRLEQRLKDIVQPQLDMLLNVTTGCAPAMPHVQDILTRLSAVETNIVRSDASELSNSLATASDVEHLRSTLASTEKDMATLARSFAGIVDDPLSRDAKSAGLATPGSETSSRCGSKDPQDVQRRLQRMSTELSTRLITTETNFTGDLNHVRQMLAACLALLRAMHEDVQDLQPRVGSLEVQIMGLQVRPNSQVPLQQQQVAKVSPEGPSQPSDALNDPASILASLQRLLLGRSQDSPVNTANEAQNQSPSVAAAIAEVSLRAQRLSRPAIVLPSQPQDSSGTQLKCSSAKTASSFGGVASRVVPAAAASPSSIVGACLKNSSSPQQAGADGLLSPNVSSGVASRVVPAAAASPSSIVGACLKNSSSPQQAGVDGLSSPQVGAPLGTITEQYRTLTARVGCAAPLATSMPNTPKVLSDRVTRGGSMALMANTNAGSVHRSPPRAGSVQLSVASSGRSFSRSPRVPVAPRVLHAISDTSTAVPSASSGITSLR